ncbi:MAG: ParB/RepB/Spo0J family partition protein [Ruminococcus sp.]|jgi:ParB family chromosome partitioning protein|nr:ParB/RepB/Spo0J family partition protein [Ruminococcus sp.]
MAIFLNNKSEKVVNRVINIGIEKIYPNPYQPRSQFGSDIDELAESIKENGILQPLTVRRRADGNFELVAGERRLRASKRAGFTEVPCIEVTLTEQGSAVMALVENIQRRDLNFFDEAEAIGKLIHFYGITQEDAARRLGKTQSTIANKLRILRLSDDDKEKILTYGLTERHARALLRLEPPERTEAIENIRLKRLNVEHTERMIDNILMSKKEHDRIRKHSGLFKDVRLFANTISKALDIMRAAGVEAEAMENKTTEYIEYIVRIKAGNPPVDPR